MLEIFLILSLEFARVDKLYNPSFNPADNSRQIKASADIEIRTLQFRFKQLPGLTSKIERG